MTNPLSLASVNEFFSHNYWARDCDLRACAVLTKEQFLRSLGSSFESVRDTLVHMMGAEWLWLERWRGQSPEAMIPAQQFTSLDMVTSEWSGVEHGMRDYLAQLTDADLLQPVTYKSQKGDTFTYELWRQMIHLLSHQSYHRGQVATLLRQLGAHPPAVDFLPGYRAGFGKL